MAQKRFKLVFNAGTMSKDEIGEAKNKLSALLKIKREKFEKLFSGRPVVIRSDVDHQTALKYKKAFELAGTTCQLLDIRQKSPKTVAINEDVEDRDGHEIIICPNCDFEQKQSTECIRCGVIISKYRDKKPQNNLQQQEGYLSKESEVSRDNFTITGDFSDKRINNKWILSRLIPQKLEFFFRGVLNNLPSRKNPYVSYIAKVLDIMMQALLLIFITIIIYTVFIYMCKIAWYTFIETPVGKTYIELNELHAQNIFDLLSRDLIRLSILVTLQVFLICLVISAVCQLFHIARYFYLPRGFFGRIICWGLPLAAVVTIRVKPMLEIQQFGLLYLMVLGPTLCVFSGCFKFTDELLPEIGTMIGKTMQKVTKRFRPTFPDEF